jgi:hypothetical protein
MTTKKKVLIALGVIATVGIGYFIYKQMGGVKKVSWAFKDNHWLDGATNKLGFIGVTKPKFAVADKITIKQNTGATYPQYDGITSISSITQVGDKWVITIPKTYRGSTPVNGGVITSV